MKSRITGTLLWAGVYAVASNGVTVAAQEALELLDDGRGVWSFRGEAEDVVVIEARSAAFDPVVQLWSPAGAELGSDNDGGEGSNARLLTTLPVSGRYSLAVTRAGGPFIYLDPDPVRDDAETGSHEVEVRRARAAPLPTNGSAADGVFAVDAAVDAWSFTGEAEDVVVVEVRSGAFDPTVQLLLASDAEVAVSRRLSVEMSRRLRDAAAFPGEPVSPRAGYYGGFDAEFSIFRQLIGFRTGMIVGSDDDGGLGTDARLVAKLPVSGRYVVGIGSASGSGPYEVQVIKAAAPALEVGRSAAGRLR